RIEGVRRADHGELHCWPSPFVEVGAVMLPACGAASGARQSDRRLPRAKSLTRRAAAAMKPATEPGWSEGKSVQSRRGPAAVSEDETGKIPTGLSRQPPRTWEGAGSRAIRKPEHLTITRTVEPSS